MEEKKSRVSWRLKIIRSFTATCNRWDHVSYKDTCHDKSSSATV